VAIIVGDTNIALSSGAGLASVYRFLSDNHRLGFSSQRVEFNVELNDSQLKAELAVPIFTWVGDRRR
jgi:hypothetical protein